MLAFISIATQADIDSVKMETLSTCVHVVDGYIECMNRRMDAQVSRKAADKTQRTPALPV